jgi:uncharacterized cupin superfamily protein
MEPSAMSSRKPTPPAFDPAEVPARVGSSYPKQFRAIAETRQKRPLGDQAGLRNFGVNLVTLPPGAGSALRHHHSRQDEFVFVLSGELTLATDEGDQLLGPGTCAGFRAGVRNGHHLVNRSDREASYIEIGDRSPGDEVDYPDDDLLVREVDGEKRFVNRRGEPY